MRKAPPAKEGLLLNLNEKADRKVKAFRKQIAELWKYQQQQPQLIKRGVKANSDYLKIAIDNLENYYIRYEGTPYDRKLSPKSKQERVRKRNEISALESRIIKKLDELKAQDKWASLRAKVESLSTVIEQEID